jgi:hypothetical protein
MYSKNFRGGEGAKNFLLPHTPKEFFAPEQILACFCPAPLLRGGALFFLRIFDKISSSDVV